MMQNRLKAALPTIVDGPRSPVKKSLLRISMTDKRISGADEPRAISVKLATVAFQTLYVMSVPGTRFSFDVIVLRGASNGLFSKKETTHVHHSWRRVASTA